MSNFQKEDGTEAKHTMCLLVGVGCATMLGGAMALGGGALPGGPVRHIIFTEHHSDATRDDLGGNCGALFQHFVVNNGTGPADLRTLAAQDTRAAATGFLMLQEDPMNPLHPGHLVAHHTLCHHQPRAGHPATPWDGRKFMMTGDVIGGSPQGIFEVPPTLFSQANHGNVTLAPQHQQAVAQFNAGNVATLGPYQPTDVGVRCLAFRNCIPVPHEHMRFFPNGPLTVRQGVEVVGSQTVADGLQGQCQQLLDWLLCAVTTPNLAAVSAHLLIAAPVAVAADRSLTEALLSPVDCKLPGRQMGPIHAGGVSIAQAVDRLAQEQRDARTAAEAGEQSRVLR